MNHIRKVLCFLTALVLATLAFPSFAADDDADWWKQYDLDMDIVSAPPARTSPPFIVSAKIRNNGLLPIGSFTLSATGLTIVGVSPPANGKVVGSFPGSSVSITRMRPLFWSDSITLTLQVSSCGDGVWSPVAWLGGSLNGPRLDLDADDSSLETSISCGSLASGATFTVPDSLNANCVMGERGYYDKDGSIPTGTLPYFVTDTLPANDQLHFRWPDFQTGGDPLADFEYAVCGTGPPPAPGTTQVAWLNIDGSPASTAGTPAFVTGQPCLQPDVLPAPYGTLTAAVTLSATTIAVDTTTPPRQATPGTPPGSIPYPGSPPIDPNHPGTAFDIVIGTERITVHLVCLDNDRDPTDASDCTEAGEGKALAIVQRGVGGTTAATHAVGALVMSTPLPLLPTEGVPFPYTGGNQALMCIAGPPAVEGNGHASTFIDIGGDGHVSGP